MGHLLVSVESVGTMVGGVESVSHKSHAMPCLAAVYLLLMHTRLGHIAWLLCLHKQRMPSGCKKCGPLGDDIIAAWLPPLLPFVYISVWLP